MRVLLNLLPEEGRESIRKRYYNRFFFWQAVFLLGIELFYLAVLGGILLVIHENRLSLERTETERVQTNVEVKKIAEYESQFRDANRLSGQTLEFHRRHLSWTELFLRLDRLVPDRVSITSLATKEYGVFLSGYAVSRDDFLEFEKRLKSEPCFTGFVVPVSNLFSEKDVEFQVDFSVREECARGSASL